MHDRLAERLLQSHTEEDLHLSVERGLWATQSHNELVLDQAFRSSGSVFLIFSANRSGGGCRNVLCVPAQAIARITAEGNEGLAQSFSGTQRWPGRY